MTELQKELLGLIKQVDTGREAYTGIHQRVADKGIYTGIYITKFKKGDRLPADEQKIKELIKAYETELHRAKKKAGLSN